MQLSLAGFVHVGGTLAIEKSSQTLKLADGKSVQTDMLTVGGTDLQMFVGVGGPYRTDTNGDGLVSSEDEVNTGAIGLSAIGGEFALGLFYEKALSQPRSWVALQASLAEVAMVGVPGLTATGSDIEVAINQVSGVAAGTSANTQRQGIQRACGPATGSRRMTTATVRRGLSVIPIRCLSTL